MLSQVAQHISTLLASLDKALKQETAYRYCIYLVTLF